MINKIKEKLLNHHLKRILFIALPIVVTGLTIGGYFMYQSINKPNTTKPNIIKPITKPVDPIIFPKIKSIDFYHLIEFENGIPFIGEIMMAAIIKDIVTRLGSVDGMLSFYIVKNSSVESTIYFKWIYEKKEIKKTYIISIKGL